jgi:hypothetical protein
MKLTKNLSDVFFCALVLMFAAANAAAQVTEPSVDKNDPNQVLVYQGDAVLTQHEIDAAFNEIPEHLRLAFIRDGAKVDQLAKSLLEAKMLSKDAAAHGLTDEPLVVAAMQMAATRELAKIWTKRIPELAPDADFEAMAKEDYLANPKSYDKSASIDITQILISTDERSLPEAEEIARDLKTKLDLEPEKFQEFVALYSDDQSKLTTFGQLKNVTKGKMVPPFEKVAFAMETVGEISEPVTTQYGVHLIRLDAMNSAGIPPFEKVREEAIQKQKREYQQSYLRKYLSRLFSEPAVFPEGSVEVMAKRHFGENLELAPIFKEDVED